MAEIRLTGSNTPSKEMTPEEKEKAKFMHQGSKSALSSIYDTNVEQDENIAENKSEIEALKERISALELIIDTFVDDSSDDSYEDEQEDNQLQQVYTIKMVRKSNDNSLVRIKDNEEKDFIINEDDINAFNNTNWTVYLEYYIQYEEDNEIEEEFIFKSKITNFNNESYSLSGIINGNMFTITNGFDKDVLECYIYKLSALSVSYIEKIYIPFDFLAPLIHIEERV